MSSLWCPLQHWTMSHCNKLGWSHDLESPVSAECAKLEDVHLVVLYLYVFRLLTNTQDTNYIFCLTLQFNLDSSPVSAIVCQFGVWFSLNCFFNIFFLIYSSRAIDEEIPLNTNILSLLVSSVEQQWDDICMGLLMFYSHDIEKQLLLSQ